MHKSKSTDLINHHPPPKMQIFFKISADKPACRNLPESAEVIVQIENIQSFANDVKAKRCILKIF